jgi:predicted PurR-regulated permease PerM
VVEIHPDGAIEDRMPRRSTLLKRSRLNLFVAACLAVAVLYFAQEVLIPLVLAVLLTFLLAPVVRWLERKGLGRIPAVLATVVIAFAFILEIGWVVGGQLVNLAENAPQYQDEIVRKVRSFRGHGAGLAERVGQLGHEIEKAADGTSRPSTEPAEAEANGSAPTTQPDRSPLGSLLDPFYTVPLPSPRAPLKTMGEYLGLVLGPLGTAAVVVVFVVFMLLEREDLRDRMIRLVSGGRYMTTTRALDDAGRRISRYMLAQTIVNGSYGAVIMLGLWLIGFTLGHGRTFPNFFLWGLLCAVLRFIPYIGPWVAAAFPVTLSLAVYPGFSVFAATACMFVLVEVLSNNVMEPWLYGASTGLSTVAILVAAVFWTWLWGPIGLLLSTPLTVCLAVLGRHVPMLNFLDVLLGDQPALEPHVRFYQRLLARDPVEAEKLARAHAEARGPEQVPDDVAIPALLLARRDREREGLPAEDESYILDTADEIMDRLAGADAGAAAPPSGAPLVLGLPAHHRAEEVALHMLARLLRPGGYDVQVSTTRSMPSEIEARVERDRPAAVFVAVVPPGGLAQARYLWRRLRRKFPELKIVVGYWGRTREFDRLLVRLRAAGASYVATSLAQGAGQVKAIADVPAVAATAATAAAPAVAAPGVGS